MKTASALTPEQRKTTRSDADRAIDYVLKHVREAVEEQRRQTDLEAEFLLKAFAEDGPHKALPDAMRYMDHKARLRHLEDFAIRFLAPLATYQRMRNEQPPEPEQTQGLLALSPSMVENVTWISKTEGRIAAVKMLRANFDCSLRVAKDTVWALVPDPVLS